MGGVAEHEAGAWAIGHARLADLSEDDPLLAEPAEGWPGVVPEGREGSEADWLVIQGVCENYGRLGAAEPDWAAVAEACESLLTLCAKDLRVAGVYLAAEWFAGRPARMARAAAAYAAYVDRFWADMPVPARERGRLFARLADPLIDAMGQATPSVGEHRPFTGRTAGYLDAAAVTISGHGDARPDLVGRLQRLVVALKRLAGPAPAAAEPDAAAAGAGGSPMPGPLPGTAASPPPSADTPEPPTPEAELAQDSAILDPPPLVHARLPLDEQDTPLEAWLKLSEAAADWRNVGTGDYWPSIQLVAEQVLESGAKDLRAAGMWLVAAWWAGDAAGLRRSAAAYRILCERFWSAMPLPPSRRGALFVGFGDVMVQDITAKVAMGARGPFAAGDMAAAAGCAAHHLRAAVTTISADQASVDATRRLVALLARIAEGLAGGARLRAAAPDKPIQPGPAPVAAAQAPAEKPPAPVPSLAEDTRHDPSPAAVPADVRTAMRAYAQRGFAEASTAKADWRAFILIRQYALWHFQALTTVESGQERPIALAAPAEEDVARLLALRRMDAAAGPKPLLDLLARAELAMASFPFWLDHHCAAAAALGLLGADGAAARAAVIGCTATLVRRFPDLPDMRFENGRALADAETRRWIATEVLGGTDLPEGAAEAQALAGSGRAAEALALLAARRASTSAERTRFRLGLVAARLMLQLRQVAGATLLLEELAEDARRHALDRWEPELLTAALRLQIEAYAEDDRVLGQALRSDDPRERLRAESELRARDSGLRGARRRLVALDPAALVDALQPSATRSSAA